MVVGILRVELSIPWSNSLKDKRHVVRSVVDTVRSRFNASAAEVDYLDIHRKAGLGFVCVSNDMTVVNRLMDKILDFIESNPECEVVDSGLEII